MYLEILNGFLFHVRLPLSSHTLLTSQCPVERISPDLLHEEASPFLRFELGSC